MIVPVVRPGVTLAPPNAPVIETGAFEAAPVARQ